jgi:hypothetical protein
VAGSAPLYAKGLAQSAAIFRLTQVAYANQDVQLATGLNPTHGMSHSIICDRAFEFAVRVVKLCDRLADRGFGARHIAKQLVRCGTSIGANSEEAQEGQTKADYHQTLLLSVFLLLSRSR